MAALDSGRPLLTEVRLYQYLGAFVTRATFPLFQSHLDLAHSYWQKLVRSGDTVIDATCGNGHDSLFLAHLALSTDIGTLYGLDIQSDAIESTKKLLQDHLAPLVFERVNLLLQSHAEFPKEIPPQTVKLIVYNLGYLPGGDKSLTTRVETTLKSLEGALMLLEPAGCVSITTYPGHSEGAEEERALLAFLATLDTKQWSCCYHRWVNRGASAPGLMFIQRGLGLLSAM